MGIIPHSPTPRAFDRHCLLIPKLQQMPNSGASLLVQMPHGRASKKVQLDHQPSEQESNDLSFHPTPLG